MSNLGSAGDSGAMAGGAGDNGAMACGTGDNGAMDGGAMAGGTEGNGAMGGDAGGSGAIGGGALACGTMYGAAEGSGAMDGDAEGSGAMGGGSGDDGAIGSGGYAFFAMIARMKHINRWGLMRNTRGENVQEHSLQVAMIAHALAVIGNLHFGGSVDANRAAVVGMFHDCDEILTGDLPTPIKYFNGRIRTAYREVEAAAADKLLSMLPESMRGVYGGILAHGDGGAAPHGAESGAGEPAASRGCETGGDGGTGNGPSGETESGQGGIARAPESRGGGAAGAENGAAPHGSGADAQGSGADGSGAERAAPHSQGADPDGSGADGQCPAAAGSAAGAASSGSAAGADGQRPAAAGPAAGAAAQSANLRIARIVKAADAISAHIKCIEELASGNSEFRAAAASTLKKIESLGMPEAEMFMRDFIGAFSLSLDEFGI
jgi:5'-deoxynucleotidase